MDESFLNYRVKAYYAAHSKGANTILYSGHTTERAANELLDRLLASGIITGGHIEEHVQGIGWIVQNDTSEEPEPRYPHGAPR